jgi:UPF0716 protein FxsA
MQGILRLFERASLIRLFLQLMLVSILLLVDGFVLIRVADRVGDYLALSLSAATGLISLLFLVNSATTILDTLRQKVRGGRYPTREFNALAGVLLASLFMLTPGFFTDAIGTVIYLPPVRNLIGWAITARLKRDLARVYEYLKLSEFGN